ncbi:hypothetical protein PGTUg99_013916 [Puccinia graminis f. sp. tritici]|uniref:Uncharacterized protein n=1 Tax=Puccinia graminis f. sp. tritici TaxID=56615 RepID=A0A5B0NBT4_PUCGR|nr:hypothetical protein PGTUg99_013916 [Puccinia graminis f. sp. tritici]
MGDIYRAEWRTSKPVFRAKVGRLGTSRAGASEEAVERHPKEGVVLSSHMRPFSRIQGCLSDQWHFSFRRGAKASQGIPLVDSWPRLDPLSLLTQVLGALVVDEPDWVMHGRPLDGGTSFHAGVVSFEVGFYIFRISPLANMLFGEEFQSLARLVGIFEEPDHPQTCQDRLVQALKTLGRKSKRDHKRALKRSLRREANYIDRSKLRNNVRWMFKTKHLPLLHEQIQQLSVCLDPTSMPLDPNPRFQAGLTVLSEINDSVDQIVASI